MNRFRHLARDVRVDRREHERLRAEDEDREEHRETSNGIPNPEFWRRAKHLRWRGEDVDEIFPERRLGLGGSGDGLGHETTPWEEDATMIHEDT